MKLQAECQRILEEKARLMAEDKRKAEAERWAEVAAGKQRQGSQQRRGRERSQSPAPAASRSSTFSENIYSIFYVPMLTLLKLCALRQVWGAVHTRPGEAKTAHLQEVHWSQGEVRAGGG